jgi:maltodextrin utilization protein YvdJ
MKKLFSFVLGLLLLLCPLSLQAQEVEMMPQEEIVEAPALEPITEKQLNDLFGEEMYLGTLDLRGNKVDTKRDYSKKKKK